MPRLEPRPGHLLEAFVTPSLGELLRQSASRYPDQPALVGDDLRLTYSQLLVCVEGIADRLGASGVPSGAKVGLSVNRGAAALLGSAAIMLHGCAYVPLPVGSHSGRLQHMVDQAALDWALCDVQGGQTLAGFDLTVVHLGPDDFVPRPVGGTRPAVTPDTSAYVIFTSGSTGTPKGVEVTHGNVLALLADAVPLFGFGTDEAWPLQHGYEFDVSVWEMWAAISVGATLIAIPGDGSDPQALAEGLLRHRASRLHIVPSIFRHLCEVVAEEDIKVPLRNVTFAGEALHHGAIQDWTRSQPEPHPQWLNAYGITETTVYNTVHELSAEDLTNPDPATPIGPAYPNSPIVVVNAELTEQPDGSVGELYIGGRQVTLGYVGNPAVTAERFHELPGREGIWYQTGDLGFVGPDGGLRYVGRADDQVKIRGTRVELGEVEHVLRALPWVRDAAAAVHQSSRAEPVLAAAVVAESVVDDRTALQQVRKALKGMPAYLVPSRIVVVERLPLNSNGKIDRRAVTALFE